MYQDKYVSITTMRKHAEVVFGDERSFSGWFAGFVRKVVSEALPEMHDIVYSKQWHELSQDGTFACMQLLMDKLMNDEKLRNKSSVSFTTAEWGVIVFRQILKDAKESHRNLADGAVHVILECCLRARTWQPLTYLISTDHPRDFNIEQQYLKSLIASAQQRFIDPTALISHHGVQFDLTAASFKHAIETEHIFRLYSKHLSAFNSEAHFLKRSLRHIFTCNAISFEHIQFDAYGKAADDPLAFFLRRYGPIFSELFLETIQLITSKYCQSKGNVDKTISSQLIFEINHESSDYDLSVISLFRQCVRDLLKDFPQQFVASIFTLLWSEGMTLLQFTEEKDLIEFEATRSGQDYIVRWPRFLVISEIYNSMILFADKRMYAAGGRLNVCCYQNERQLQEALMMLHYLRRFVTKTEIIRFKRFGVRAL